MAEGSISLVREVIWTLCSILPRYRMSTDLKTSQRQPCSKATHAYKKISPSRTPNDSTRPNRAEPVEEAVVRPSEVSGQWNRGCWTCKIVSRVSPISALRVPERKSGCAPFHSTWVVELSGCLLYFKISPRVLALLLLHPPFPSLHVAPLLRVAIRPAIHDAHSVTGCATVEAAARDHHQPI
jgi:hypothetical protein